MSEGEIAYMGDVSSALEQFRAAGYPCKDNFNPADHFIFTLAIRPGIEDACRDRCQVVTSHLLFPTSSQNKLLDENNDCAVAMKHFV